MLPTRNGSLRLFRFSGIAVFLHWSWFAVAVYTFSGRAKNYDSPVWGAAEYIGLFLIVLMHEFGHALACRSTGGAADQIVLWPFGGVAYVAPPQRPGAQLWSIAAGPLVNVALAPILYLSLRVAYGRGLDETFPDFYRWLDTMQDINLVLLIFNLLPIYPLDGGQILRSVLWYFTGPATSLLVATVLGFIGGAGLLAYGLLDIRERFWVALIAAFLLSNCFKAFQHARALRAQLAERKRSDSEPPPFQS